MFEMMLAWDTPDPESEALLKESSFCKHPIFHDENHGSLFYISSTTMAVQLGESAYGALSLCSSKSYGGTRDTSNALAIRDALAELYYHVFLHQNKRYFKCTCNQKIKIEIIKRPKDGIICSGVAYYVHGIVMKGRWPIFIIAFNALCLIITALLGSIILAEEITLGRVIGAVIIYSYRPPLTNMRQKQ